MALSPRSNNKVRDSISTLALCVRETFVGRRTQVCFATQNSDNNMDRTPSFPFNGCENQFQDVSEMFFFPFPFQLFHFLIFFLTKKKKIFVYFYSSGLVQSFRFMAKLKSWLAQNVVKFCESYCNLVKQPCNIFESAELKLCYSSCDANTCQTL